MALVQPQIVLIWNGQTLPWSVAKQECQAAGIPTLFLERGFFPDSMFIDPEGVNAASKFRRTYGLPDAPNSTSQESPKHDPQATDTKTDGDALNILIPEQLDLDTNTILHCPNLQTNDQLLAELAGLEKSGKIPYFNYVYRPHPKQNAKFLVKQQRVPRHFRLDDNSTAEALMTEADAMITRNSAMGLEFARLGKPTISLGNSIYTGLGFTRSAGPREMTLSETLQTLLTSSQMSTKEQKLLEDFDSRLREGSHYFLRSTTPNERGANQRWQGYLKSETDNQPASFPVSSPPKLRIALATNQKIQKLS
ncbi:uncharacterized protein METZ01_LOCUS367168, partial [marine metagenome]